MLTIFVKNFLLDETEIRLDFMIKGALKQSHLECIVFFFTATLQRYLVMSSGYMNKIFY